MMTAYKRDIYLDSRWMSRLPATVTFSWMHACSNTDITIYIPNTFHAIATTLYFSPTSAHCVFRNFNIGNSDAMLAYELSEHTMTSEL
jgi:hypothetical protein